MQRPEQSTFEASQPLRIGGERLGEHLQRHVAVELGVTAFGRVEQWRGPGFE